MTAVQQIQTFIGQVNVDSRLYDRLRNLEKNDQKATIVEMKRPGSVETMTKKVKAIAEEMKQDTATKQQEIRIDVVRADDMTNNLMNGVEEIINESKKTINLSLDSKMESDEKKKKTDDWMDVMTKEER